MPNCYAIDPLVTRYVDDELPDADRELVDHHVRVCAPCHSRVLAERAIHDLIRARRKALGAGCAPPALHARCAECAGQDADAPAVERATRPNVTPRRDVGAPRRATWAVGQVSAPFSSFSWFSSFSSLRSRLAPLALAASLVLLVGIAFLYQLTASSARVMATELAADHIKCFAMNGVLHTHAEPATVESSMLSGFGWRMRLPSAASTAGLELVGSRPCLYGEGKVAHIMYRDHGEPVSLFMLPRASRAREVVHVLGHRAAIWCDGDRTFVLIARQPKEEIERMASLVQASMK